MGLLKHKLPLCAAEGKNAGMHSGRFMSVLLHAVPLAGVCRKERSSAVPPVRAGPEEMRCVGSKRTPEMGRDMLLAASIVNFSGPKAPGGNRTVFADRRHLAHT